VPRSRIARISKLSNFETGAFCHSERQDLYLQKRNPGGRSVLAMHVVEAGQSAFVRQST